MIKVKRVYDDLDERDVFRILVDRLWPRGLSKGRAKVDLWLRDIAPSDQLRDWFRHDPEKWDEFKKRYFEELDGRRGLVESVIYRSGKGVVTLLYGTREERFNNAAALKEYIEIRMGSR